MFEPAEGGDSHLESESHDPEISEQEVQLKEEIPSIPKAESPVPTTGLNKEAREPDNFSKTSEEEIPQAGEQTQREQAQPEGETPKEMADKTPVVLTPEDVEATAEVNALTSIALKFVRERNRAREGLARQPIGEVGRKAA